MKCELIAVGTELLLGEIANTDAQMLSQGLSELGINVYHHTVVGDNPERLSEVLEIAKKRADIIITTGGLGPTADDLTKETIAACFGKKLYMDEEQQKRLHERMGERMTPNNEKQAMLPEDCEVLVNDWGTAPGCAFYSEGCHVIMLPGPPSECTPMFKYRARPYLERLCTDGKVIRSRFIKIFGMGESAMEDKLSYLMNSLKNPTAAPYAKEGECEVRVTAKAESEDEAYALIDPVVIEIKKVLGDVVYGVDVSSLEEVIVKGLTQKGLTLATAESCTGGLLGKRITDISGSSSCYLGGAVTYSNEVKMNVLGVSKETLKNFGAVSAETAIEMARGVRKLTGADIGISTTGIAGPGGGSEEKPVGTVYIALSAEGLDKVVKPDPRYMRTRQRVRNSTASHAFNLIRQEILEK
ncbi:MAG: competence/damage-inducible protein A [Clostridiaceae bacterium]|nr:competence/damage-inducible protein A [Clostridiaceae bacterium]